MNDVGLRAVLFFFEPVGRWACFLAACVLVALVMVVKNCVALVEERNAG